VNVSIVQPVIYSHVRRLLRAFQNGPFGLNVASHVAEELNSVTDHAPTHDQKTMELNARDQLMKQRLVLLKCAQHQLLEAFQNGPFGLNVASHVAVELNSVTDHAPTHDQKTTELNARDQLMKQRLVLLECAQHQ